MAKVYLDSGDSFTISNNNTSVYGAGGTEVLTVASGVTGLTFDSNCERVALGGASSAYSYQQQGVNMVVYSGSTVVATIPLQTDTDGTQMTFTNGTVAAKIASGVMTFGGTTVTAGTASSTATTLTASTIDTATTSSSTSSTSSSTSTSSATVNTDNVVGTSGNDSIDASRYVSTAGTYIDTLNNADSINGGSGTDTLSIQLTQSNVTITPASITNVETISLEATSTGGGTILSLANADSSVATIKAANNAGAATISNIQSVPTAYEVSTTAVAFTAQIPASKLTGSSDAATLLVTNVTGSPVIMIGNDSAAGGNGYETFSITSSGTASNAIQLDDTGNAAATGTLATVNVDGSNKLTLAMVANATTVTTVNASTMTGNLTFTAATGNAKNMAVTGGTGNDTLNIGTTAGDYTTSDTVNGGSGTDTLVLLNAAATAATATQSNISGIENISTSDGISGTVTLANFGSTGFVFSAASAGNSTIAFPAGSASLNLQNYTLGHTLALNSTGVATTDALTLTLGTTAAASGNNTGAKTLTGFETLNVVSQGGANTLTSLAMTNTASTEAIVVTGNQNLTLATAVTADSIDASGMSSTAGLIMGANGNTASMTITGSPNADTLIGGTAADIISAGSGNDTIQTSAAGANTVAADVVTGGAGYDTFKLVGSTASTTGGNVTTYSAAPYISDFTVGTTTSNTDFLSFSASDADFSAYISAGSTSQIGLTTGTGAADSTAGAEAAVVLSLAAGGTTAMAATANFIKLTTAVAFTTDLKGTVGAALSSGSITGATSNATYLASLYDSTNSRMVLFTINAGANATTNTTIDANDAIASGVQLIGTVNMTSADYTTFAATNIAAFF